jgi:hypothetical protein
MLLNGSRFFEMISHYAPIVNDEPYPTLRAENIRQMLNEYTARNRTGDKYVRSLFDAAVVYYRDRFGDEELDRAVEKLFVWAYSLRLRLQGVQIASVDNFALDSRVFHVIRTALSPSDVLNMDIPKVQETKCKANLDKLTEIVEHFKVLNSYE